jgi:hypothetical protein
MVDAWNYSETVNDEIQDYRQSIVAIMMELDSLSSLMVDATTQDSIDILNERGDLLIDLDSIFLQYKNAENSFLYGTMTSLQTISDSNDSIFVSFLPAVNEWLVNQYQLEYWLNGNTVQQSSLDSLFRIAVQCPLAGGNAVFRARNLFEVAADTVIYWERLADCIPPLGGRSNSAAPLFAENGESDSPKIRVYPNPAINVLIVEVVAGEDFSGEIILFDLNGRLVYKTSLQAGINTLGINLPSGIYIASLFSKTTGVISRQKVVVFR